MNVRIFVRIVKNIKVFFSVFFKLGLLMSFIDRMFLSSELFFVIFFHFRTILNYLLICFFCVRISGSKIRCLNIRNV